jgi:hypothetical protein
MGSAARYLPRSGMGAYNIRLSIRMECYATTHVVTLLLGLSSGISQSAAYITLHYITLHYITLHYITLHYITLHYITLHYITLHYITLHAPLKTRVGTKFGSQQESYRGTYTNPILCY